MNHFNSQLRYMSEEEQVGAMRTWFFKYYEDPANETPYEGEYIYIQGGPYDAETELRENFEGIASENAIITLTEELAELGSEWAPTHTDTRTMLMKTSSLGKKPIPLAPLY